MDWAALLFQTGAVAFGFLVPILSGFIAYAIADRPGLVPGIVGGAVSVAVGAGFLGGLVTGFMAGFLALWISRWKVPKGVRGVMPVVVIPLLSTFVVGLVMFVIIGQPIASLMTGLSNWLNGLSGSNLVLLGALLGAMMGFDLGGPINKVAYTFAVTGLATQGLSTDAVQYRIMAAVMAAGMVAPLAMALATVVRKQLFTHAERENGKAAWLLGLSFISEGAIPFAAADPWRVIVSSLVGSSVDRRPRHGRRAPRSAPRTAASGCCRSSRTRSGSSWRSPSAWSSPRAWSSPSRAPGPTSSSRPSRRRTPRRSSPPAA